MSDNTKIEWSDASWNAVTGCTKVSPGCDRCYAETFAERWRGTPGHHFEQGFDVKLWPNRLTIPLHWKRPRKIFVNSMSDVFHEAVPDHFIARMFGVMARAPQHTFQVLTKRHARMRSLLNNDDWVWAARVAALEYGFNPDGIELNPDDIPWPLPNAWIGVSVEDQKWADIRIPALLEAPAAVRFLSCEPLLGPVSINPGYMGGPELPPDGIDWIIAGGESGPGARPMHPAWARSLRDQCRSTGVPFFFKQYGAWRPLRNGEYPPPGPTLTMHEPGATVDPILVRHGGHNGDSDQWPADMRVREFPAGQAVAA